MRSHFFLRLSRSWLSRMAQCRGSDLWGPFPTYLTANLGMTEQLKRKLQQALIYTYISAVSGATLWVLALREWDIPAPFPSKFWNAIAAFVILGIVSESFSFTIPVASRWRSLSAPACRSARLGTELARTPLLPTFCLVHWPFCWSSSM